MADSFAVLTLEMIQDFAKKATEEPRREPLSFKCPGCEQGFDITTDDIGHRAAYSHFRGKICLMCAGCIYKKMHEGLR